MHTPDEILELLRNKQLFHEAAQSASPKVKLSTAVFMTPLGQMIACASAQGLCLLEFTEPNGLSKNIENLCTNYNAYLSEEPNAHLQQVSRELEEYFEGKRKHFEVALDMKGTAFQREVWQSLLQLPFGGSCSYQQQARRLDKPSALRAVASANGQNKLAIVVPCHRVIGADGQLRGYAGGLDRKRWLLDFEKRQAGKPRQAELDFS